MIAIQARGHWAETQDLLSIPPGYNPLDELRRCLRKCIRLHLSMEESNESSEAGRLMLQFLRLRVRREISGLSSEAYARLVEQPFVVVDGYVCSYVEDELESIPFGTRKGSLSIASALCL